MSQTPPQKPTPITAAAESAPVPGEVVEQKQSFVAKTKHFVRTHKRPALAAAALVSLVGIAAVAGRKTAPLPDFDQHCELESSTETEESSEPESETTVA
jgi:hypothetical protein